MNRVPAYQLVAGAGCMAGASRVSVESGSGMAAEGRYEGRLTTAREGIPTV